VDQEETDLAVFARLSAEVQAEYATTEDDPWEASPFQWILGEASRRRGAIGERLVKAWARRAGIDVRGPTDTGHDCVLDLVRVEVKFSTLWKNGGYKFQQIRDQSYEVAALLGLQPQIVQLWIVPKDVLWERSVGQHTGADAQDTKWLSFQAAEPPDWLDQYGGTLAAAEESLKQARRALGR
jgi:hypothetical protein